MQLFATFFCNIIIYKMISLHNIALQFYFFFIFFGIIITCLYIYFN